MVQYTIDDFFGDQRPGSQSTVPTYLPPTGQWDPVGGTCHGCVESVLEPTIDPSQAHSGTWHSTTVSPDEVTTTISITFNGTSISAYCLLPPDLGPYITSYMNLSFQLDGQTVGTFERIADTLDWTYNYSVYTSNQLNNGQHTFVVQPRADVNTSYMVFDYFAYDFEETTSSSSPLPSSSSSSSSTTSSSAQPTHSTQASNDQKSSHQSTPVAAIAGGTVAGVVIISIMLALLFWLRRRRRNSEDIIESDPKHKLGLLGGSPTPPQITPFTSVRPPAPTPVLPYEIQPFIATSQPGDNQDFRGTTLYNSSVAGSSSLPSHTGVSSKMVMQEEGLRRMQEEMERRLAAGEHTHAENTNLRREIENLRAQVEELRNAAVFSGMDEPPPTYEAEMSASVPLPENWTDTGHPQAGSSQTAAS